MKKLLFLFAFMSLTFSLLAQNTPVRNIGRETKVMVNTATDFPVVVDSSNKKVGRLVSAEELKRWANSDTMGNYAKYRAGLLATATAIGTFETQDAAAFKRDIDTTRLAKGIRDTATAIRATLANNINYVRSISDTRDDSLKIVVNAKASYSSVKDTADKLRTEFVRGDSIITGQRLYISKKFGDAGYYGWYSYDYSLARAADVAIVIPGNRKIILFGDNGLGLDIANGGGNNNVSMGEYGNDDDKASVHGASGVNLTTGAYSAGHTSELGIYIQQSAQIQNKTQVGVDPYKVRGLLTGTISSDSLCSFAPYSDGNAMKKISMKDVRASATNFATKSANYTAVATDDIIQVTANSVTITLPTTGIVVGKQYTVKLRSASSTCTVASVIDGTTNYSLSANLKYVTVVWTGTDYSIIANN